MNISGDVYRFDFDGMHFEVNLSDPAVCDSLREEFGDGIEFFIANKEKFMVRGEMEVLDKRISELEILLLTQEGVI